MTACILTACSHTWIAIFRVLSSLPAKRCAWSRNAVAIWIHPISSGLWLDFLKRLEPLNTACPWVSRPRLLSLDKNEWIESGFCSCRTPILRTKCVNYAIAPCSFLIEPEVDLLWIWRLCKLRTAPNNQNSPPMKNLNFHSCVSQKHR